MGYGILFILLLSQSNDDGRLARPATQTESIVFLSLLAVFLIAMAVIVIRDTRKDRAWRRQWNAMVQHDQDEWRIEKETAKREGRSPDPRMNPGDWCMR